MATITNISDLRMMARRRLPRAIFDYADGGSYDEHTLAANRDDFRKLPLRQRVMNNVEGRSTGSAMLGTPVTMPVGIAPTGLAGLFWVNGEVAGARAAQAAGVPFCLSTMSICSIEDVRAAVDHPFWFQLYIMRDRGFVRSLVERAAAAECSALMLTVDFPVQGQRHRDLKNGLVVPPRLTASNLLDLVRHTPWAFSMMFAKRKGFGNLAGRIAGSDNLTTLSEWIASQFDASLSWSDVEWIRSIWPGKLVIKGILDRKDAAIAASVGVDAIIVSNHGGRQLDGARSSITALPRIAESIGNDTEIWFDGGIQSGQEVMRALACGASACFVGKAFLYGLGAMGEDGVALMLEILRRELDATMAFTGVRDVRSVDGSVLDL